MKIRHEERRGRFVVDLDGEEGYLSYRERDPDTLDFVHTFVPPDHRHGGIGEDIVLHALGWARERGLEVVPSCPFVSHVLEEHPEFGDIAAATERKALPKGEERE